MICSFTIPGDVVPWARAGGGKSTFRFTPKRQRDYGAVLRDSAREAMGDEPPVDEPVEMRIVAVYQPPKSRTRRARESETAGFKGSKPDADNIQKIIKDALNKIVFTDDARVAVCHTAKIYGERPELRVSVHPLSVNSWPFNERPAAAKVADLVSLSEAA